MRMHAASDMPAGGGALGGRTGSDAGSRAAAAALPIPAAYVTRVRLDEPMAGHCSWHAGGTAQAFFNPRDLEELTGFLRALPLSVPVYWIGLGTNLLVRDGGIRGVVIGTAGAFTRIERRSASTLYCEASVPCARIARNCANWSLPQAEFFAGIPGSLGGALAMNAGAFGDETWRHVLSVETIDRAGQRRRRDAAEYQVGYRAVALRAATAGDSAEWFLSAQLRFDPQAVAGVTTSDTIAALMQRRRETQPLGTWSCGSVFKNPPGDHAARLIDSAGLKGTRIGDALVSEKHANFIINCGQARAGDLEQLIRQVQSTVQQRYGILLEPEVRIVGEESA